MDRGEEIPAEDVLRRARTGAHPTAQSDAECIQTPSAAEIMEALRARFTRASDVGVWNRLSTVVLEPANPFDPRARRRLRRETAILGALVFAVLAMAAYFNFYAIAR